MRFLCSQFMMENGSFFLYCDVHLWRRTPRVRFFARAVSTFDLVVLTMFQRRIPFFYYGLKEIHVIT